MDLNDAMDDKDIKDFDNEFDTNGTSNLIDVPFTEKCKVLFCQKSKLCLRV